MDESPSPGAHAAQKERKSMSETARERTSPLEHSAANGMVHFLRSLVKSSWLLALVALVLLCGCGSWGTTQASQTPTPTTQTAFTSYVGRWEVHDSLLAINANHTGLEQWNVGPCAELTTDTLQCEGTAAIAFTVNADGSLMGSIQSISYRQWNGHPAPTGFRPNAADPRTGDTFLLQHSGGHLLYTTWFGRLGDLNHENRYWCDAYAVTAGWKQCGA